MDRVPKLKSEMYGSENILCNKKKNNRLFKKKKNGVDDDDEDERCV